MIYLMGKCKELSVEEKDGHVYTEFGGKEMKHEVTTLNTKRMLAGSLKKLMEKKPLSRITVSELIKDCGVNRKTFYYHFTDIYNLLKWILDHEAIEIVKQFDLMTDFEEAISFILQYVATNKHILACAYDTMGREQLKNFLSADFYKVIGTYIEKVAGKNDLQVDETFIKFLTHMYTEALAGMLLDIIISTDLADRQQMLKYISLIAQSSLPQILKTAEDELCMGDKYPNLQ